MFFIMQRKIKTIVKMVCASEDDSKKKTPAM
jgi:hypothetical protein